MKKAFDKHQHRIPHALLGMIIVMSSLYLFLSLEPLKTAVSSSKQWPFTDSNAYTVDSDATVSGGFGRLVGSDLGDDDNTAAGFGSATMIGVAWDGVNSWVELTTTTNVWKLPGGAVSDEWVDMSNNVLLMHLDESGSSFTDASGTGNNGSCSSCPTQIAGKLLNARQFSSDYITIPDHSSLNPSQNITVMAWVRMTSDSSYPMFVAKGINAEYILFQDDDTAGRTAGFRIGSAGSGNTVNGSTVLTLDTWHHIVGTYDGNTIRLYVDGELDATQSRVGTIPNGSNALGVGASGTGGNPLTGDIDEVAIFSEVMDADTIAEIYERQYSFYSGYLDSRIIDAAASVTWDTLSWIPSQPFGKELPNNGGIETAYSDGNIDMSENVLLYHLEEGSGSITDNSGNSFSGSYNGSRYAEFGKIGQGLGFDGVNDRVVYTGAPLGAAPTADVSIGAWVKLESTGSVQYILQHGEGYSAGSKTSQLTLYYDGTNFLFFSRPTSYGSLQTVTSNVVPKVGQWYHVVGTIDSGGTQRLYVDGIEQGSVTVSALSGHNRFIIGADGTDGGSVSNGYEQFAHATFDEVFLFDQQLSEQEIDDMYRRGANKLKFQVRSCDDPVCSVEGQFVGPDGTPTSTYSELLNSTTNTPSVTLSNVPANQYVQYRAWFETGTTTVPELKSVSLGQSSAVSTSSPTIIPNTGQLYTEVTGFTETLGAGNQGSVTYQISKDGSNFYYHNGSNWVTTTAGVAESNSAADVNSSISNFDDDIGVGTFFWKAFLTSNGTQQVEIDSIEIDFTYDGAGQGNVQAEIDIQGAAPSIDSIIFTTTTGGNAETNLSLTNFTTTSAFVHGSFTHPSGCSNVTSGGTITSMLYRSGVGASCAKSDEDCYMQTSCTVSNCSGGSDTTADYECAFDVHHFADPTNGGGPYTAQNWVAAVTIEDSSAQTDSDSTTFDIDALAGLTTGALLDYGTLAIGATSGDTALTITNTGNVTIDTNVSGTAMTCEIGSLATSSQHYATSTGIAYGSMFILSSTPQLLNLNLAKQTVSTTLATTGIQWKLQIPSETLSGVCSGTTTLSAVASS